MNRINFEGLGQYLLSNIRTIVPVWLPGGKLNGAEWCCGDLRGSQGQSLRVNMSTGKWSDFATGDKGGDLISLYAAINNLSQKEAALKLSEDHSFTQNKIENSKPLPKTTPRVQLVPPPKGTKMPDQLKKASKKWRYTDVDGNTLFLVARHDNRDGKKFFCPWSWSKDGEWVKKMWPAPRPLYGLSQFKGNPKKPVLIVEGEKAADHARTFLEDAYIVVTWPSGSKAFDKADWKPLRGRRVLIWPDADKPGVQAAESIVRIIYTHCPEIKVLSVNDLPDKWDAADSEFKNLSEFVKWAKPRAQIWKPPPKTNDLPKHHADEPPEYHNYDNSDPGPTPPVDDRVKRGLVETFEDQLPHGARPAQWAQWEKLGIACNDNTGNPYYNVDNAITVLEGYKGLKNHFWFDEFHSKYYTLFNSKQPREITDTDYIDILRIYNRDLGLVRMTKQLIIDAVQSYSEKNKRNEPKDWMDSLSWDGTSRVQNFFASYMGAIESEYTQAVSKNFWVSLAARIYKPGCKADNMVILEGKQGAFKSTALSVIGGDWYTETNEHPSSKDFYQVLQGNLIVEIAELDSFNKAERNTIKKVVSTPKDRYRPPYGRSPQNFPRQCIFVGTTNESHYLNDPTGARRFWPIQITDIDLGKLKQDREQLFAEAVNLFKKGELWHQVPKEKAEEEQEMRRDADIWENVIASYIESPEVKLQGYVTIQQVALKCLQIDYDKQNKMTSNRIGAILRGPMNLESKVQKIPGTQRNERRYLVTKDQGEFESVTNSETTPRREIPNYAPQFSDRP